MKEFRFDLDSMRKNLNLTNFLKDITKLNYNKKAPAVNMFLSAIKHSFKGDKSLLENIYDEYDENEKNKNFKLKINKSQFDGSLLPKLNKNFKLEHFFDFGSESHYLVKSKLNNNYLYIFCSRQFFYLDNQTIYGKHDTFDNYVKAIFKKKLNKIQFFEYIIKQDKKNGLFMSTEYAYTSTKGINYYELYEKGKLK